MRLFLLPLGWKMAGLWLYSLIITISFVMCLREVGETGPIVYIVGLGSNAYTVFCGWFGLIRGWHK